MFPIYFSNILIFFFSNVPILISNVLNLFDKVPIFFSNCPTLLSNAPTLFSDVNVMFSSVPNLLSNDPTLFLKFLPCYPMNALSLFFCTMFLLLVSSVPISCSMMFLPCSDLFFNHVQQYSTFIHIL